MHTRIQKWGNSQGIRIARHLLKEAQIELGDEVNISVQDGALIISPLKNIRGRYKLEDLVKEIPADYQAEEVDWGEPVGKEVW